MAVQPQPGVTAPASRPSVGAAIAGVGRAVPPAVVSNASIAERLGVDEDWIASRTGTRQRHVLADGERLSDLCVDAARSALAAAEVVPADLDLVVIATTSPDEMSPHTSAWVAGELGAPQAGTMDISAACTGFLAALSVGVSTIESGRARNVVVLGADGLSRYLDPTDRGTAMLFGDGAGAMVLTATDGSSHVGPIHLHNDRSGAHLIRLGHDDHTIRMDGRAVYRHAVDEMADVTLEAIASAGVTLPDVDLFVYHQANGRILDAVGRRLDLDADKVVNVIPRFANTSAATLPMALSVAHEDGRLRPGATVVLAAFGAGLVWGGTVLRWPR